MDDRTASRGGERSGPRTLPPLRRDRRVLRRIHDSVAKTTITFKGTRRGFAGARPNGDRLQGYFDVTYRVEDPRIRSVAPYQKDLFVHHFRVDSPEQLDAQFSRWIADSYDQVGCGKR